MDNNYYQINKKTLQEKARNCYHKGDNDKAKEYSENNKDKDQVQARNKYIELFKKEKDIKREYERNRYMSEKDTEKLRKYQKIIVI